MLKSFLLLAASLACWALPAVASAAAPRNIVLIYADDIGYGDFGCNGATAVATPNVDRVAREGIRFTDAHSTSATCTPSRYAILTGQYPWRKKGTDVLPGDARLIIEQGRTTLPSILKRAGYRTGIVGKWHLGLGATELDWNGDVIPGPLEIGFDEAFVIPATGDRVPCVYIDNHRVFGLDPSDPIQVSYGKRIGSDPIGAEHPELLKMKFSHGHDRTIVNGISRIGYMTGGQAARWVDEDMADVLTKRAVSFIEKNREQPFFLYFATHDIHVPRVPNARFVGKTTMGPRGDAIVQFDWSVGEILAALDHLKLTDDTLVLVSSDNGPVVDDGYQDDAVAKLGQHKPAGPFRGGKYSTFEGGTRIPLLARWPARIKTGESAALVSQVDFPATFAALTGQTLQPADAPDSLNVLPALLGESAAGREQLVENARVLSLRQGNWKYTEPAAGQRVDANTKTELGGDAQGQLFDLEKDPGEQTNLISDEPERAKQMKTLLQEIRSAGRSRPE